MLRGIAAAVGSKIVGLRIPRSKLQRIQILPAVPNFRRRIVGRTIRAACRRGKRVVLELDSGDRIVIEPRMTGLVLPADPPDEHYLRLAIDLSGGPVGAVLFWDQRGLGVVQLMDAEQFDCRCGSARLGPDALQISVEELRQRMGRSRKPIKVALMDQQMVAGIGNLYASEILHRAKVSPLRPCCKIRGEQWDRMHAAIREILEAAIRCEGSTLADGTYRMGSERSGGYQHYHRVYQRAGQPCKSCSAGRVERIVQTQRSTFYCPKCQR